MRARHARAQAQRRSGAAAPHDTGATGWHLSLRGKDGRAKDPPKSSERSSRTRPLFSMWEISGEEVLVCRQQERSTESQESDQGVRSMEGEGINARQTPALQRAPVLTSTPACASQPWLTCTMQMSWTTGSMTVLTSTGSSTPRARRRPSARLRSDPLSVLTASCGWESPTNVR